MPNSVLPHENYFGARGGALKAQIWDFLIFRKWKKMCAGIVGYHFFPTDLIFGTAIPSSRESVKNMFIFFLTSSFARATPLNSVRRTENCILPPKVFQILKYLPGNFLKNRSDFPIHRTCTNPWLFDGFFKFSRLLGVNRARKRPNNFLKPVFKCCLFLQKCFKIVPTLTLDGKWWGQHVYQVSGLLGLFCASYAPKWA